MDRAARDTGLAIRVRAVRVAHRHRELGRKTNIRDFTNIAHF